MFWEYSSDYVCISVSGELFRIPCHLEMPRIGGAGRAPTRCTDDLVKLLVHVGCRLAPTEATVYGRQLSDMSTAPDLMTCNWRMIERLLLTSLGIFFLVPSQL